MSEQAKLWMTWPIRIVFVVIFCALPAWLLWLWFQGYSLTEAIGGRLLTGNEALSIFGVSIAIFGGWQGLFRWLAIPNLEIRVHGDGRPKQISRPEYAVHHIQVWNHNPWWWLRPLFLATAPEGCQAKFKYSTVAEDARPTPLLGDQWLFGRWDANPQPLALVELGTALFIYDAATANRRLAKLFPTEKAGHVDANPFTVSFAIKKEGDKHFYHFNDESYGYDWCKPDWRLPEGTYRVEVRITGYGLLGAKTASFRLRNNGPTHNDFVLEPW